MRLDPETIHYLFRFLCADESVPAEQLFAYCKRDDIPPDKAVVVLQSDFFDDGVYGTERSLPALPLQQLDGVPILFGEPQITRHGNGIVLHADIIASAFFLLSRYEETARPSVRDAHGRFPGRASLPCRAGFIDRPIVEEYGRLLRNLLREAGIGIAEPQESVSKIWLTHDVDVPWMHFTPRTFIRHVGGMLLKERRLHRYPFLNVIGKPEYDPLYTFPQLIEADAALIGRFGDRCRSAYFILAGSGSYPEDHWLYIHSAAGKRLIELLTASGAALGVHISYEAGLHPALCQSECDALSEYLGKRVALSRHHYLTCREPDDMDALIRCGITDDFTMGYADIAGFRLSACRPVRWIHPASGRLTPLLLHPLLMMDRTLSSPQYMHMDCSEAQAYGRRLIDRCREHGGEITLLWHNSAISGIEASDNWRNYASFLEYIAQTCC